MYRHGPSCLQGPVSRSRPWWTTGAAADVAADRLRCSAGDSGIRLDLVARVRAEIAAGVYETPEKWERALSRLLEQMTG
jgi:hypothetical protein